MITRTDPMITGLFFARSPVMRNRHSGYELTVLKSYINTVKVGL